ncbi:MAG: outer membrane protein transport protein [Bacteroidales bacterium]|jgi:long-chain fatty acid transport protein|nr:outer membrane protein transport protein [Bacteroidales bacterium]
MKKLVFIVLVCLHSGLFAGGLVTNTNQSAMFTRFQCRDATIDIDAAYYNPAGLVHFSDGYFLSVNNMSIGEVWKIESDYENFTDASEEFNGRVQTPVFPSVYSVYKTGRFAFSGSVNIVSGSGTVNYKNGLPSLERQVADLVPYYQNYLDTLIAGDITDYEINAEFSLRSYFPGLQFNVAYLIDSYWSVAAGMRIVRGKNHYKGSINSISVSGTNVDGVFEKDPVEYLRTVAENASEPTANELNNIADNLEDRITREIDAVQLGYGFTPVLSVNYAPSLYTNWAVKYEFKTKLGLTTDIPDQLRDIVIIDGDTVLVDGAEVVSDIPAMLSLGLTRRPSNRFMFYAGLHYYFDKPVDFDGFGSLSMEMIEKNSYELAFGAEYKLANALRISAGWLLSRPGVNKQYQEATRFSLASNTLGGGIGWRVSDLIDFNLGVSYTLYKRDEVEYERTSETLARSTDVKEYYDKRTFVIALGVDFLFGEN